MKKFISKSLVFCFFTIPNLLAAQPFIDRALATAQSQTQLMVDKLASSLKNPNSVDKNGRLTYVNINGWTSGFFPGTLWYMYEYTNDDYWKTYAKIWTSPLAPLISFKDHHDVGFMVGCSFGNGYRLTKDSVYKKIIIGAAESLSTRFNPKVGLIKSWDRKDPEQYLVIIDNMMNLELLFMAYRLTGEKKYYNIAVSHANNTLKNHFRPDGSSYHVVDYNSFTGEIRRKHTSQGYADESAWARGQAWGLYGYTMCYRETGDQRYLMHACKIANYIMNHENLPKDGIMYWDFNAPNIPDEPRDVSAAAIVASALLELSTYAENSSYFSFAEKILNSLSNAPYLGIIGENNHFILTNSVGSFPHNSQVSVPLVYADYYFIEALVRYKNLKQHNNLYVHAF